MKIQQYLHGMFERLKQRWNVSGTDLALILLTFAFGGSLCGWLGRKILTLVDLDHGLVWVIFYLLLVLLLWPVCVIALSILTGQYAFFKKYLHKIKTRMFGIWISHGLMVSYILDYT